jgi:hypothetical protein
MNRDIEPISPTSARYLGICVRPDGFGFVVIEDTIALDCGVRMCEGTQSLDCLSQQFERILRMYGPTAVVILATESSSALEKRGEVMKYIKRAADRKSVEVIRINEASLREHFRQFNAENKYEVALVVTRILPELAWRLPPKRKPWQSEQRRTSIFDAAAAVIAHAKL